MAANKEKNNEDQHLFNEVEEVEETSTPDDLLRERAHEAVGELYEILEITRYDDIINVTSKHKVTGASVIHQLPSE